MELFCTQFLDPEEMPGRMSSVAQNFAVRPARSGPYQAKLSAARLGDLGLFNISMTAARVSSGEKLGFVSVNLPSSVPLQVGINRRLKTLCSDCAYVHDPQEPLDLRFPDGSGVFVINLFDRPLADYAAAMAGGKCGELAPLPKLLPLRDPAGRGFQRFAAFIWSEIRRRNPLITSGLVAEELQKGLFTSLLLAADRGQDHAQGTVPPACLRRAVDYIMGHLLQPLSLGKIAGAAGVHARTLQRAFQAQYGMGVMMFVRDRRLRRAYEQFLAADAQTLSVTDVALANGFWHLGRFSAAYERRFGELPSHTLRR